MTIRFSILVMLLVSAALAGHEVDPNQPVAGMWAASLEGERLQLHLTQGKPGWNNFGFGVALRDFTGLSEALAGAADLTPVAFELRKEAGTVAFTGHFRQGEGSGHYRFTAQDRFIREMQSLGYAPLTQTQLFRMAIHNLTPAYVRDMHSLGYRDLGADQLLKLTVHRVTPDFIRELGSLGYTGLSADQLKKMGIHGATPAFIRELQAVGYRDIPADKLVKMRIHGVTPAFIREMREAGFEDVTPDQLIKMRIHGIDSDYVRAMRKR